MSEATSDAENARTEQRRRKGNTCHADFVQMIRRKLKKNAADGVLHYLLQKYLEYKSRCGHCANDIPRVLWNYEKDREMEPVERVQLLKQLVGGASHAEKEWEKRTKTLLVNGSELCVAWADVENPLGVSSCLNILLLGGSRTEVDLPMASCSYSLCKLLMCCSV
jgi:hypothetical protein